MNTEMQEFNQYIKNNNFKPVTPFYNVTVRSASSPSEIDNIIMDIYVGVK